jgi:large subunit ribosomal protein L3
MNGILGKKVGMTQVFDESGLQIPVTIIEAGPCAVVQVKTQARDGYSAAQLGFDDQREHRLTSPLKGHYKKGTSAPKKVLKEFAIDSGAEVNAGDTVSVSIFEAGKHVDITAQSKGKGFQGVVKRYNFRGGRKTHGGHAHRAPGSIGQCTSPSRVMKGQKMPGHMGNRRITVQNLKIIQVREEDNALLVEGAVPGPNGAYIEIRKALKKG